LAVGKAFEHPTRKNRTVFAYIANGSISAHDEVVLTGHGVVFGEGDLVRVSSKEGARFLFVTGEPLKEPVAWRGPIVMNTQDELDKAFTELDEGTFIKTTKSTNPPGS
jgi:redox-sensitive bicupin YhaK (pirin superfamily)